MAIQAILNGLTTYTIVSGDGKSRASFIPEKGGICYSIIFPDKNEERELLFLHDYFSQSHWFDLPGGWPFLFPVCARVERDGQRGHYLYEGHIYQMPQHGFAWQSSWEVLSAEKPDELIMFLRDNPATRAIYPFSFEVKLLYKIGNGILICEQIYTNLNKDPMPYSVGFHPYFLTPAPEQGKDEVILDYQPVKCFSYNKDYTDLVGTQPLFQIPTSITNPQINEKLTLLGKNKKVALKYTEDFILEIGAAGIEDLDLFPYLQLYTMPDKPFFCVEPWMSFPNAINAVKGMRWLAAGQSEKGLLTLQLRAS